MYIIWYQRTDSSHSSISNYNWITTLPCLACVGDWYRLLSTQIIEYDAWYESQRRVAILAMDTRMVDCPVWILPKWHPYSVGWFVLSSFAIRDGSSLGQLNTRPITFHTGHHIRKTSTVSIVLSKFVFSLLLYMAHNGDKSPWLPAVA